MQDLRVMQKSSHCQQEGAGGRMGEEGREQCREAPVLDLAAGLNGFEPPSVDKPEKVEPRATEGATHSWVTRCGQQVSVHTCERPKHLAPARASILC